MTGNSIEVSLRAVMDYLDGKMERAEFERIVPEQWLEQLRMRLEQGRSVAGVSINYSPETDDDGLVIKFGGHDAARSRFADPNAVSET